VRDARQRFDWPILRKALLPAPPVSVTDPNRPLWPHCQLLEWFLLSLDDESYKSLHRGDTIEGTDILASGDPVMDAEIAAFYKGKKSGQSSQ